MRIILAATPAVGHLHPLLAAGRILHAAGHELVVLTGPAFRERCEAIGARFAALPGAAGLDLSEIDHHFPERRLLPPGPAQLRFDFERVFVGNMAQQFAALEELQRDFPAELIVADTLFGGILPYLLGARESRPVIASLGVTFLPLRRDDHAPMGMGLPPARDAAQRAQYAAMAEQVEAGLFGPVRVQADAVLAALGAAPLPLPYADALVTLPDVYLQPTVPQFEYPRSALPPTVHFIGALPSPPGADAPPEIAAALAQGKRIVLVTQGTVANLDLGQLLAPALAALAGRDDLLVLATTGGRPLAALPGALPENARAYVFLPFDKIMPLVDVLVTNGGYGAVTQALAHGVAVVAAGTSEDKRDVNARIAWCGAGIDLGTEMPSQHQLRAALDEVLGTGGQRARARQLAAEFSRYDTRTELCRHLEEAVAAGSPLR